MNINELCLELNKVLHASGWLAKATEFFQNHPELYAKSASNGYIASLTMALSFQPDSLSSVKHVKPIVMIESFKNLENNYSLNEYSDSDLISYFNMYNTHYKYSSEPKPIDFGTFTKLVHSVGNMLVKHYRAGRLTITHKFIKPWSADDFNDYIESQDIKDPVEYYQDSRHVWCIVKGQFWEDTKTGETGQDTVIMEAWF